MAVVHFINSHKAQSPDVMASVMKYTMKDAKTSRDGVKYVSGVNCTPETAYTEFRDTKRLYGKEGGRQYYHFVQSFSTNENIDPDTAHKIALRFASETEKFKGFEILVSTHCDRDHIHSHFVVNSVSFETGKKFHIRENEIEMLMKQSDEIVREYGLSILPTAPKKSRVQHMSDREYRSASNGQSWKMRLAAVVEDAMELAQSKQHFISLMEMEGYAVKWTDERKYITYTTPDGFKCRDNKLHEEKFLKENMEFEFRIRKEITAAAQRYRKRANAYGFESGAMRGGHGTELESDDSRSEFADKITIGDHGRSGSAGVKGGYRRLSESAVSDTEEILRGQQSDDRAVSDRGTDYGLKSRNEYTDDDERYGETGWEDQRKIFEQSLYDGEENGEVYFSDVADPVGNPSHIGTDTAYLVADLTNILDNDHPVEDCTTMRQPIRNMKKHEQNHGPVMGSM